MLVLADATRYARNVLPCRDLRSRAEQLNLIQQLVWPNRLEELLGQAGDDDQSVIEPQSLTWQTTAFEADTGRSALAARTALLAPKRMLVAAGN